MRYTERYKSHHDAARALKRRLAAGTDAADYLTETLNRPAQTRRAVYLHVPFCNKVCSFCPFHRPDALTRRTYDAYLIDEIKRISGYAYMRAPVNAVNFGGGTPTALSPAQMERVLVALKNNFDIPAGTEISVETSVTELGDEMLDALALNGVNRLSVGVQTFDDATRKTLNRRGGGERAIETIRKAIARGIVNTGIDLIYNYPDATRAQLARDLEIIKSLNLSGVSFYSLMLHEGTPLYGRLTDDERRKMRDTAREYGFFSLILDELTAAGYEMFELTKLIRSNLDRYDYMRIKHERGSCIAIGHGAGGNLDNYIYHNAFDAPPVSERLPISARGRVVKPAYMIIDAFINALQRTSVDLGAYSALLGLDLERSLGGIVSALARDRLLAADGQKITLTKQGLFWGNNIIAELIDALLAV